jgi:hypothetical protein
VKIYKKRQCDAMHKIQNNTCPPDLFRMAMTAHTSSNVGIGIAEDFGAYFFWQVCR